MGALAVLVVLLCSAWLAWGDTATHGLPDQARQRQVWHGDSLLSGYIASGCLPTVPGGLILAAYACEGYVRDTTTDELLYVAQEAATVTLANVNGLHWVALSRDRSTSHSGWTRRSGTHYLHRQSSTPPAEATGLLLINRITVAGGVITVVKDLRRPASYARAGVFDVRDPLYGGVADCNGTTGTDNSAAFQSAIDAAQAQRGKVVFDGWMCLATQLQVTLTTYDTGLTIEGNRCDLSPNIANMVPGGDSRMFFSSTDVTKGTIRVNQDVFSSGGSFTPLVLRDFCVQAASGQQGLTWGIRAYGIPIHAWNVGAFYFDIGWNLEEMNGARLYNIAAQYNKSVGLRLVNVYEPVIIAALLPSNSSQYHGGGVPYSGVGLTISGAQFGRIEVPHLAGSPKGMVIDGASDLTIVQPYCESNDNGSGTLTCADIGTTTTNSNLQVLNPHQQGSQVMRVNKATGGRIESMAGLLTQTTSTLNVDLVSTLHPTLSSSIGVGPETLSRGNLLLHHNFAPDGFFIHQPLLSQFHMVDVGGGTSTETWDTTTPAGPIAGRYYWHANVTAGTNVFSYPLSLGNHNINAGVRVYCDIYYTVESDPGASFVMEWDGVDAAGAAVAAVSSASGQLTETSWTHARFAENVPTTGGLDTLTTARLLFTCTQAGELYIASIYCGLRPEPTAFSARDNVFAFSVSITAAAPAVLSNVGPPDYLLFVTPRATAIDTWMEVVAGHWEVQTTSVGAITVNVLAVPVGLKGYYLLPVGSLLWLWRRLTLRQQRLQRRPNERRQVTLQGKPAVAHQGRQGLHQTPLLVRQVRVFQSSQARRKAASTRRRCWSGRSGGRYCRACRNFQFSRRLLSALGMGVLLWESQYSPSPGDTGHAITLC